MKKGAILREHGTRAPGRRDGVGGALRVARWPVQAWTFSSESHLWAVRFWTSRTLSWRRTWQGTQRTRGAAWEKSRWRTLYA